MKVKKNLNIGDIIHWKVNLYGEKTSLADERDLMVTGIYSHHITTIDVNEPYNKFGIQNVDLWLRGLIKSEDIMQTYTSEGNQKFFDRAVM